MGQKHVQVCMNKLPCVTSHVHVLHKLHLLHILIAHSPFDPLLHAENI